jgi:hypothetical protein
MAANEKNFQNFKYTDDNAVDWTKRGEDGGAAAAVDGHAAGAGDPTWINSSRMRVRKIIYQNATNFRTIDPTFYTPTAYAAVALGDTLAVQVPGDSATHTYVAVKKIAEKQPARGTARQLAD